MYNIEDNAKSDLVTTNGRDYDDIVPMHYQFDPATEELLYSDQLRNGMVVLTESDRGDEVNAKFVTDLHIRNRWCKVSEIRHERSDVIFIGLYGDGLKATRCYFSARGWYVKKDSIPVWGENLNSPEQPKLSLAIGTHLGFGGLDGPLKPLGAAKDDDQVPR